MRLRFRRSVSLLTAFCGLGLLLASASVVQARDLEKAVRAVPNPRAESGGWVADPANAIAAGKAEINALIADLEARTSAEIAVVVLPSIGDLVPKQFATELFNTWGVGKRERDNGILILHVLDQRRIEIETGYGMEGVLPDVKVSWIVQEVAIPFFRAGSFSDGHREIVAALIRGLENPDILREELIGAEGWRTQPGDNVDPPHNADYALPHSQSTLLDFNPGRWTLWGALLALPGALLLWLRWIFQYRSFRKTDPEPYEQYKFYKKKQGGMFFSALLGSGSLVLWELQSLESFWSAFLVLASVLGVGFQRSRHLKMLRNKPRIDPQTGKPMRRLDEKADDEYLKDGHVSEEELGSMDYDVWVADRGYVKVEAYAGWRSAESCKQCGYKTFRRTKSVTITAATTSSSGLAEDTYECYHCPAREVRQRVIPQKSSSSGGGSGGGGSSFGGGSSGGGGAGGSY